MESPLAVANFFIKKGIEAGRPITPMQVLKLVYISHGWHLGLTDPPKPLISEKVQAWKYGPVIPSVYQAFRIYESRGITEPQMDYGMMAYPNIEDSDAALLLQRIWDVYGDFDGLQLSTLTHQSGTPWDIVWNKNGGKNKTSAIIDNDIIAEHYKTLAAQPAPTNEAAD